LLTMCLVGLVGVAQVRFHHSGPVAQPGQSSGLIARNSCALCENAKPLLTAFEGLPIGPNYLAENKRELTTCERPMVGWYYTSATIAQRPDRRYPILLDIKWASCLALDAGTPPSDHV
jgi:hypothetical protein